MASQTVGQRISQLIAHLGVSKNAFAASLDKTATVIQHLVDERNKPGFDLLCKIFEVYPNVSKDWLLQGNGVMLTSDESIAPKESSSPVPIAKEEKTTTAESKSAAAPVAPEPAAAPVEKEVSPAAPAFVAEAPVAPPVAAAPFVASSIVAPSAPASVPTPATVTATAAPTPTAYGDPNASLQAALYAQQLTHQLALAEMRNQHLQEQQRMMQQMMEMMQRQLSR
ncbi:hypothetical protein [Hymenobacter sp. GOD-10R]|uniref:hypothetical protein n=1 Tax=Hymenobacter sp. GOD-10R TaxID=3093922 RepID=UPI002D768369|nr:hypothetical protein [Hymenobacter sp. GOD-10R]WRQ30960.1 hypothetical protein SD425_11890 [Hymenobacter sp. GOD-10R]